MNQLFLLVAITVFIGAIPSRSFANPCESDMQFREAPIYTKTIIDPKTKEQKFQFTPTLHWATGKYEGGGKSLIQLDPTCGKDIQALVEARYLELERIRGNETPDFKNHQGDWVIGLQHLPDYCQNFKIVERASSCNCKIVKTDTLGVKLVQCDHSKAAVANANHAEPNQKSTGAKINKTGVSDTKTNNGVTNHSADTPAHQGR